MAKLCFYLHFVTLMSRRYPHDIVPKVFLFYFCSIANWTKHENCLYKNSMNAKYCY